MREDGLLAVSAGWPAWQDSRARSADWDEVQEFCAKVYMPYRVRPLWAQSKPDATMRSVTMGTVILTRFAYGVPIHLDRFDPASGNILVLNTLRGALRHPDTAGDAITGAGDSYVVDPSRTPYWLDGDPDHMQLNLTIPRQTVAQVAERWFGFLPDDSLWARPARFGGPGSRWQSLLDYVTRSLSAEPPSSVSDRLHRHLEEILVLDLLREWSAASGARLDHGGRAAAPWYVRQAEEILAAEAHEAPAIGAVAARVGINARTLSEGFRRFRGMTPREWLIARRLDGFRRDLETAPAHCSVSDIASDWGYVNLGALAGAYRRRFGETPMATRLRARG